MIIEGDQWVVGVGVEQAVDVALAQHFFKLGAQFLATVVVDVEMLHRDAQNAVLELMHWETRVDEEHGVLLDARMTGDHEGGEGTLHGTHGGHAVGGINVEVEEALDKAGGFFL